MAPLLCTSCCIALDQKMVGSNIQHFHYCLYKYGHAIHVVFIDCMLHFV